MRCGAPTRCWLARRALRNGGMLLATRPAMQTPANSGVTQEQVCLSGPEHLAHPSRLNRH
jgi:hypothetical protein